MGNEVLRHTTLRNGCSAHFEIQVVRQDNPRTQAKPEKPPPALEQVLASAGAEMVGTRRRVSFADLVKFDEDSKDGPAPLSQTLSAMRSSADSVTQARIQHGPWVDWADVLLRVHGQSSFGPWRYEPVETKLATETRMLPEVQRFSTLDRVPSFQPTRLLWLGDRLACLLAAVELLRMREGRGGSGCSAISRCSVASVLRRRPGCRCELLGF